MGSIRDISSFTLPDTGRLIEGMKQTKGKGNYENTLIIE